MNPKLLFASVLFLSLSLFALAHVDALVRHRTSASVVRCEPAHGAQPAAAGAAASPQSACRGAGSLVFFGLTLLVSFALSMWSVGSLLAPMDSCTSAALPIAPQALATRPGGALSYLQDNTRGAGEFVILRHAEEDLEALSAEELEAAVARARQLDPTLEHRQVAGHWILRRPRMS